MGIEHAMFSSALTNVPALSAVFGCACRYQALPVEEQQQLDAERSMRH